ncbi:uncharacterized protein F5Z01DRAFT_655367 [Emericellopsis atlantica]|uniref:Uncharacterized protein n=1 Tax=Emericellopsis atlantica TaxID=2614577 RepID=A0A9P7ZMM6_9HYPO|nr:uncharacterized protein F5Z01DRAFT_655367 [Emericellopsis atlantica]KAG9254466.1 hypothetical protein F5Z01DRAFT_655367 [Emericellopsis atlantica]
MDADWQAEHFSARRIGHGKKAKGTANTRAFDPRRSFGVYQLQCPALAKVAQGSTADVSRARDTLEIHGLVDGRDDALMCTLSVAGLVQGVAVLAGSRKVLGYVVRELEEEEQEDEAESSAGEDVDEDMSSIERADERERRRYQAFEKNSFRSPKFWMRWRAVIHTVASDKGTSEAGGERQTVEVDGGYVVFSGSDCSGFQGTISCACLGLENVKITGAKVVSKATECRLGWMDVALLRTESSTEGGRLERAM